MAKHTCRTGVLPVDHLTEEDRAIILQRIFKIRVTTSLYWFNYTNSNLLPHMAAFENGLQYRATLNL